MLEPAEIEACARAAALDWEPLLAGATKHSRVSDERGESCTTHRRVNAEQYAAIIRIAAYTGLWLGGLRALRWCDIDWANSTVHARRNAPTSARLRPSSRRSPARSGRCRLSTRPPWCSRRPAAASA